MLPRHPASRWPELASERRRLSSKPWKLPERAGRPDSCLAGHVELVAFGREARRGSGPTSGVCPDSEGHRAGTELWRGALGARAPTQGGSR